MASDVNYHLRFTSLFVDVGGANIECIMVEIQPVKLDYVVS
jgi:hypothetical protein